MVMRLSLTVVLLTAALALAAPVLADTEGDLQAAANAEMAGDHDRAIALSTALLYSHTLDDRQTGRAYLVRGYAHLARGETALALPDLDEVVRRDADPDILVVRGVAHRELKQYDAAIADLTAAAEKAPQNATAYCERAETEYAKQDTAVAIADYSKCIALDPVNVDAYLNRGENYENNQQFDEAVADYGTAIRLKPDLAMAYNDRATIRDRQGRYDEAIADYNEAIRIDKTDPGTFGNRGWVYYKRGDFDTAIADFNTQIAMKPDDADAYSNRGDVYFAKGDFADAASDYVLSVSHRPDDMLNRLALYVAAERAGTPDKTVLSAGGPPDAAKWPDVMAAYFLGKADMAAVDAAAAQPDDNMLSPRPCMRDFLLGEDALAHGDRPGAKGFFGRFMAVCTLAKSSRYPAVKMELKQWGAAP